MLFSKIGLYVSALGACHCSIDMAYSQKVDNDHRDQYAPSAVVIMHEIKQDYNPIWYSTEMPAPGSNSYRRHLIDLKDELYRNYMPQQQSNLLREETDITSPEILSGWEGNLITSYVPNDNDLAISNGGMIVSVINSNIYIYDDAGTGLFVTSLQSFADTLGILDSKFDPKVMYDPRADKFVLLFLAGFDPEHTHVILAFSQTNDPLGAWNLYSLPGNPKDNNRWTDFPMFALTENELFLTINLIIPDEPWQTGFSETLIWQMSLDKGYAGDTLDAVYYDSIFFEGKPLRNLNPVKGGANTYGPDMFFLSNRNFDPANDTIFIVHVTGTLDDPETELTVDFGRSNIAYGVPPQARQFSTHIFDTNDGRVLGSFYENNQIQFVSNTLDPATGFCGVYHGVITDPTGAKTITANIIGDDTLDLGYPNISYSGKFTGDDQSIITCEHTAPTVYAGVSGIFFNWGGYSDLINIHTGDTYVNILSGAYERWGDYTGSQRKYDEPGVVWMSGTFGKYIDVFPFVQRNNATWIASLRSTVEPAVNVPVNSNMSPARLFPNPTADVFTTEINLSIAGIIECYLYDMQGRLVKSLLRAEGKAGNNHFQFSMAPLSTGTYQLYITLNSTALTTLPIIKN
ncbi:MAG TPA: T9SS type A sorting domain-containing protein [Chitinophagales bacterium]|nr:T9SS type A sorting domain-containing protein [Chitinophagales bacterium]HNK97892.1 T9SS type A sorting domain-containing protein [Chitinophagales bacterium]HNM30112.1 T9SS type A sorting domain-containing protein [Chitinophagales bacterium]HNO28819.1 T9SS type A sorting domain-containing protein [Chitinophagales bacterium]